MSEKQAKAARQRVIRYECRICRQWFLRDAEGSNLCRCGYNRMPHPSGWGCWHRADAPSIAALAWWDQLFGPDVGELWLCRDCAPDVRRLAARVVGPPTWEQPA
jgi:hypothetical protein